MVNNASAVTGRSGPTPRVLFLQAGVPIDQPKETATNPAVFARRVDEFETK